MVIKIAVKGIPELQTFLDTLKRELKDAAIDYVANYLIGDSSHGLMHEPYYKYVNRQAGFPNSFYISSTGKVVPGFSSAKQHRFVMGAIARGEITPGQENRTHTLADSWRSESHGIQGQRRIYNSIPYAPFVMGDQTQTRMHKLIGWRTLTENVKDNITGAIRHAQSKLKEWIQSKRH